MPSIISRRWCFTLNNPEPEYVDGTLPPRPDGFPLRYASWQLEKGDSGTPHLQGYTELSAPQRLTGVRAWMPRAHWEPARGSREAARDYTRKEDGREAGPWEHGNWTAGGQGTRSDLSTAVETLRARGMRAVAQEHPESYVKFHRGFRALAQELEPLPEAPAFHPYPWQQRVLELLEEAPDDRTIIWVHDSKGGRGKSRLAEHLILAHAGMKLEGRLCDMKYLWEKEYRIAIFDVSGAAADHSDHLYSMAEALKDGNFVSTKYETRFKVFPRPHVIFFANRMPDEGKWSKDRVKIVDLDKPDWIRERRRSPVRLPEDPFQLGLA